MMSFGFIFFITMTVWNTLYGYRAIWDLHKCDNITWRNFIDLCIKYFLAVAMIGYTLTDETDLVVVFGLIALYNQLSYIVTTQKWHILSLKRDLEAGK